MSNVSNRILIGHKKPQRRIAAYKGYKSGFVDFYGNQVEAITGYTKEDFKTLKWIDIILDEDKNAAKEAFIRALKTDKVYTREYRIRAKDGSIIWIQEFSEILMTPEGEVDCVVGAIMDITEDKKQEEIIRRHARLTGKYLIFNSSNVCYGLPIDAVREVVSAMPATPIPEASPFMEGVINLRGKVIPIVNLQKFFGRSEKTSSEHACIIIAEGELENEHLVIGIYVDAVMGVIHIRGEDIDDMPKAIEQYHIDYTTGIAKTEQGLVIILNLKRLLQSERLNLLKSS